VTPSYSMVLSIFALALTATVASESPTLADTKSKPRNADTMAPQAEELSRRSFSQFRFAQCPGSASCSIDFGTVKANRLREINFVSCYLVIGAAEGRPLYWRFVGLSETGRAQVELLPVRLGTSGNSATYNATQPAFIVVEAGSNMAVAVTRDSSTAGDIPFLQCTVSGYEAKLQP
jgi:hypothetical protein